MIENVGNEGVVEQEEAEKAQAKGGHARAQILSPEERKEIATKAAKARWDTNLPKIAYEGELDLEGYIIPCYVTDTGVRVISGRGMQDALKLVDENKKDTQQSGSRLGRLFGYKALKPLILQAKDAGQFEPVKCSYRGSILHGYKADALADVCELLLKARSLGLLKTARQQIIATQCEILMRAFARVGITALIDEATGFQYERDKEALQEIVSRYIRKELAAWVKRFPDEFYKEIYRLKGWQWQGMSKNRYSIVGKYTIDLVYERLAPGLLEELQKKSPKDEKGRRKNKLQEWLSEDVGVPALSQHLFALITLAKVNTGWNRFVEMVDRALPKRGATLLLPFPEPDEE